MNESLNHDEVLEWSIHPSADHPVKSALTVLFIGIVVGALFQLTGELIYSFIAMTVLFFALASFFIPTRYRLDETGVKVTKLGRSKTLEWERVRTFTAKDKTLYLSPHPPASLRFQGGILILCSKNTEDVIQFIQTRVKNAQFRETFDF
ncbi:MAG: hypothetical protein WBM02_06325 [bacterium]